MNQSSHTQSPVTFEAEAVVPDDPYYASQWNLSAVSIGEAWGLIDAYAETD